MKPLHEASHPAQSHDAKRPSPILWVIAAALLALIIGALILTVARKAPSGPHIVVYTSQDKVYAEELFKLFTGETGVEIRAVYDSEAVKTVGLANRLLAERSRPQCDVFWNNEELRTRQLAADGLFDGVDG